MATLQPALSPSMCRDGRRFLGLTQEELASAAEISVSTLRRCERGETINEYAAKQILVALESHDATFIGGKLKEWGLENAIFVASDMPSQC